MNLKSSLFLLVICLAFTSQSQTIHFVTITGSGLMNGSSWANASNDLQGMLTNSLAGDEIWVAEGVYKPTSFPPGSINGLSQRDFAFLLKSGVKLYGGFNGTETSLSQRNIAGNITVLSGDFNNDDVVSGSDSSLTFTHNSENAYHVIITKNANSSTLLDGFTVSGGNGDTTGLGPLSGIGPIARNKGSLMYNDYSYVVVRNSSFVGGMADYGGAVNNDGGSPQFISCEFKKSKAIQNGGAMRNSDVFACNIDSCDFGGHYAQSGGAIDHGDGTLFISNSTLASNYCTSWGGAIHCFMGNMEALNCKFYDNHSDAWAGAIDLNGNQNLNSQIVGCDFLNNSADSWAGAILKYGDSLVIKNCFFRGNQASTGGGGVLLSGSSNNELDSMINCVFMENTAGNGGAIMLDDEKTVILNSSMLNNTGGAVQVMSDTVRLLNCIVWGNSPYQCLTLGGSVINVDYSNVQGGFIGTGNINLNPSFLNISDPDGADNIYRTADDGISLTIGSPCIDACNPLSIAPSTDITNFIRFGIFDMGAYEFQSIPQGIVKGIAKENFVLYPNPAFNSLHINQICDSLIVTDMVGRQMQIKFSGLDMDVSALPRGMYSLHAMRGKERFSGTFFKQ